jgi:hypothetical protein
MFRMSSSPFGLRSPAARMVTGAGVAIACLGALITGVAASAAATAPAAAGKASAPRQAAAAKLDHQLCYTATGQIKVPNNVKLINQFVPKGFAVKIGKIAVHCNPVTKILPTGASFPAANPRAHLLCLTISAARQASKQVIVTNQFGSDGLITGQPNLLCLPSWKSLTGPPKQKKPQPPGLSHFTCYPVRPAPGAKGYPNVPAFVGLKDEFVPKAVRAKVSDIPNELCLPTIKVIGKKVTPAVNPRLHLLCFPVSQTPIVKKVWDQNQFGTQVIKIGKTTNLCLPSLKQVIVPVDHQLCYNAAGQYKIPPNIELFNQFSPKGFTPKVGPVAIHCNPVIKTLPTGQVFGVTNPAAHLLCFGISAAQQPTPEVQVTNQFGTGTLVPGQPNLLCLPSWKSLTGPPKQSAPQPPGLSHFTCYPVKLPAGTAGYQPPNPIMLKDEFAPKPVQVRVSPVPQELCLPTEKIIGNHDFKIVNPVTHLLCFPVTKTPIVPRIWDQNQFGTAELAVHTTKWLCLPSTKRVVLTPGGSR